MFGDSFMNKQKVLVSACLVGKNCKYDGKNNKNEKIISFLKDKEVYLVCPEVMGGMTTPRNKSEIIIEGNKTRVIDEHHQEVTFFFVKGANEALQIALDHQIDYAILKEKSPSCGYKKRYDGTFSNKVIAGSGIFAQLLKQHSIKILTEEDFQEE